MARAGQITVTTAGTAVQGTDIDGVLFSLVAHPDNTDTVWVGDDEAGDVTNANGYPLQPAGAPVVIQCQNLSELYFDADQNGEKICWLRLN